MEGRERNLNWRSSGLQKKAVSYSELNESLSKNSQPQFLMAVRLLRDHSMQELWGGAWFLLLPP